MAHRPPVVTALDDWMVAHASGVRPPVTLDRIPGGYSNITHRVTDRAGAAWVLRHPPAGHADANAHDVGREARILAALAGSAVPVPTVVGTGTDPAVVGVPFFVMDLVAGLVVRDPADAARLDPAARTAAGEALVDTLAAVHAVDVDTVGLGALGRRDRYVARQLWRFGGQLARMDRAHGGDLLRRLETLHAALGARVPPQSGTALVHGDFRIDNTILAPDGAIRAVLDWELTTLGDPLADVGMFAVYWREPGEDDFGLPMPTAAAGFAPRATLLRRYAERTGRDLSRLAFYEALAQWKLACINSRVADRVRSGAVAGSADAIWHSALRRAAHAERLLAEVPA